MLFLKQGLYVSLINCGLAVFYGTVSGSGFYLQFYMLLHLQFAVPSPLKQQYPTFWAPEIGFMEDNIFHRPGDGRGMVLGRFKRITLIVCFISFIISSAPPRSPDIRSQGWVFLL